MKNHPMSDLFFNQGNKQAIEEVKYLRLAQILSIDLTNMMCNILILDKTSFRQNVPLPLPMVYPGGGIIAVPTKGAHVVVGIRPMQMPLILAYYPFNTMAPDSYFAMFKQTYGFPEELQEGEILIRARGDSAKCLSCKIISLLTAWEANLDPTTMMEQCPNCKAPAFAMDPTTQLPVAGSINKQILGSTLRMTPQAELIYFADNIMSKEDGDTQGLFELYIDGKTGNVSFANAGNISFDSSGDFFVKCQNYTVKADNSVTETTQNKNFDTAQSLVESCQDRTFNAVNSLNFKASSINESITTTLSQNMTDRVLVISGTDSYEAASSTVFIEGDSDGNGRLIQIGTATSMASDDLELYGDEIKNVYGESTVTIVGAASITASSTYSLSATEALSLSGSQTILNNGTLAVARVGDSALSTIASDPAFWAFFNSLINFLTVFSTDTPPAFAASKAAAATAAALAPASMKSLITSGNGTVLA